MEEWMWLFAKALTGLIVVLVFYLEWSKGYFKELPSYLYSRPSKFHLLFLMFLFVFSLLILSLDFSLRAVIQEAYKLYFFKAVVAIGSFLGRSTNLWPMLASFYLLTGPLKGKSWQKIIFGMLLASVVTGLGIHILKFTFLRARPYADLGPLSFFNFDGLLHNDRAFQSFPSGDTAVCAGAVAYLFYALRRKLASRLLLLLPVATALARVSLNRHWPSDTVFSIGIAFLVARGLWRYKNRKDERKN